MTPGISWIAFRRSMISNVFAVSSVTISLPGLGEGASSIPGRPAIRSAISCWRSGRTCTSRLEMWHSSCRAGGSILRNARRLRSSCTIPSLSCRAAPRTADTSRQQSRSHRRRRLPTSVPEPQSKTERPTTHAGVAAFRRPPWHPPCQRLIGNDHPDAPGHGAQACSMWANAPENRASTFSVFTVPFVDHHGVATGARAHAVVGTVHGEGCAQPRDADVPQASSGFPSLAMRRPTPGDSAPARYSRDDAPRTCPGLSGCRSPRQ